MAAKNKSTAGKSFVRMTPESEAKDAVRLFNEGLKTLACACSIYEEWTVEHANIAYIAPGFF